MSKICIVCGCDDNDGAAEYCYNCGNLTTNICTNPQCILNEGEDPLELEAYQCYCDTCGSKSLFYEEGLIEPIDFSNDTSND